MMLFASLPRLCRLAPPRLPLKRFFCAPPPTFSISASTAEKAILQAFKAQAEAFKAQEKNSCLELEKQSLQFHIIQLEFHIIQLRLQVLQYVYEMKVRGILEIFVRFAKEKMDQRGIKYSGRYPFQEILANFPTLKACLEVSTGRSEEKELLQTLYSFLTYVNDLHHSLVNIGETIMIPKQYFDGNVYDRILVCIGNLIGMKIIFTEEQVQVWPEGEAKANGDDDVQRGVSDTKVEE